MCMMITDPLNDCMYKHLFQNVSIKADVSLFTPSVLTDFNKPVHLATVAYSDVKYTCYQYTLSKMHHMIKVLACD